MMLNNADFDRFYAKCVPMSQDLLNEIQDLIGDDDIDLDEPLPEE